MDTAALVLTIVLAVLLAASGAGTLAKAPPIVENITSVDWPEDRLWILGVIKLAGAAGLLIGLAVPSIGIAAAAGATLYFMFALAAHLRAKAYALGPVLFYLAIALATLYVLVGNA